MFYLLVLICLVTATNGASLKVCPQLTCGDCPGDYVKKTDADNCLTCECVNPCELTKCENGFLCDLHEVQCDVPPCGKQPICVACPKINCTSECPEGQHRFVTPLGCETCLCDDPIPSCDGVTCDPEDMCLLQEVSCDHQPCHPQPTCVPKCPGDLVLTSCGGCRRTCGDPFLRSTLCFPSCDWACSCPKNKPIMTKDANCITVDQCP